jgi:tetratricopeptide (TPR) repeat protein/predicted regulator of Ras-like GTPase activity (Roadblock/LC7/MglB family)
MIITEDVVSAIIDEYYEIDYDAVDIDSVPTNQSWTMVTNASSWLSLDKSTGVLKGIPKVTDLGWYNVNITVFDGDGGIDWREFILEVIRPNAPPNILTEDNITAIINVQYQTKYDAKDDGTTTDRLAWRFSTNASWLDFYAATAVLWGNPSDEHIGTYWVNVSVRDGDDAISFHNFTLTVMRKSKPQKPPLNNPPILSSPKLEPDSGDTETEFIFTIHYFDVDNDPPTSIIVVIDGVINNMTIVPGQTPANGTYQCTIKLSNGEHTYYFSASDGTDSVKLEDFSTPTIEKAGSDTEEGLERYWMIWGVIFIIIIILIILSIIIQSKRKRQRKAELEQVQTTEPTITITKPVPTIQVRPTGAGGQVIKKPAQVQSKAPIAPKPTLPIPPGFKMVGRDDELSKLLGYLYSTSNGSGKTVFITGEAGIGKTRLVSEVKVLAEARSFYVLQGNCISESMTPLLPFREALRTGGLDYLFAESFPRIEAVYLLTHDGLLIKQIIRKETKLNPDMFAAMLVTVGNFVKESLSNLLGEGKEGALNTLGYENYRILIESGKTTNLVVVLSGKENEFLINEMREVFEKLNTHYGYLFDKWDGTEKSIKGIEKILQPLITSGKYDGVSRREIGPRTRRDMLFENVSLGLVRQAQSIPTLFILEDLQWSDPSSLALLYYIARKIKDSRFLIIGTYRPEDIAAEGAYHPLRELLQKMDREELHDEIRLKRLPEECIPEFLIYLLGQTEFSNEFRHRIYTETDGNPLFLIQLMKFMVEEKNLVYEDDKWKLKKDLEKIDIPSKVYNVIARRLDRLDKEYRKVLDFASVIGDTFTSAVLTESLKIDRVKLLEYLRDLEKTHRLIHSFDGKFKFDHEKIKAVLYTELPSELKVEYHAIIGATIENQIKDKLDEVVGELAFHYYQCNNKEKALYFLKLAAEKAKKNYSNFEAIKLYKKAIELESNKQNKIELYESLGDIYYLIRDYSKSTSSYSEGQKLAEGNKKAELMAKVGGLLERSGKYDESLKFCENALELVKDQNSKEEALALQNIGNVLLFKKDYSEALEYYEKSLQIREKIGDEQGIGACHNNIGLVHYGKGEYGIALEHLNKSLELRKRLGDQEGIAGTLSNIGAVYQMIGDPNKAREYYSQSEDIRQKIGEPSSYDNSLLEIDDHNLNKGINGINQNIS